MKWLLFFLMGIIFPLFGQGQMVRKVSISELENAINTSTRPMVINLWATFCKPCIDEMPWFLDAAKKYDSVDLVMVSLDLPDYYPDKMEAFLKKKNFLGARFLWLNELNADSFCPRIDPKWDGVIPVTLFVNGLKGYRRFVNRSMTEGQIKLAFEQLVK